jgi:tryptophan-rich hypothetical protein
VPTPQLRHLIGSKWTRLDGAWSFVHWEVVARDGDDALLVAVLDRGCRERVPWRALGDRAAWAPGWQPCPPADG